MLENMDIIEITGNEAESFLQGQITCDLSTLLLQHWRISAYCLPNGRVFALFYLFKNAENHFFIALPTELSDLFCQKLQKFVLRQKVNIKKNPHLGFFVFPAEADEGFPFLTTGFKVLIREKNTVSSMSRVVDFLKARIKAGIAAIYLPTSEQYLPQMLNMEAFGGISLTKGCYVGQEGIARAQYKTQIRRHLAFSEINQPLSAVEIGKAIVNDKGLPVGSVLDFVMTDQNGMIQAVIDDRYLGNPLSLPVKNSPLFIFNS